MVWYAPPHDLDDMNDVDFQGIYIEKTLPLGSNILICTLYADKIGQ